MGDFRFVNLGFVAWTEPRKRVCSSASESQLYWGFDIFVAFAGGVFHLLFYMLRSL